MKTIASMMKNKTEREQNKEVAKLVIEGLSTSLNNLETLIPVSLRVEKEIAKQSEDDVIVKHKLFFMGEHVDVEILVGMRSDGMTAERNILAWRMS